LIVELELFPAQADFINDLEHRYVAFVGGYGAGKTKALTVKAMVLACHNPGFESALLSPTFGMANRILIPTLKETLDQANIPYEEHKSKSCFDIKVGRFKHRLHILAAENYQRLAGLNLACIGIDEVDLIPKDVAVAMWLMCLSRLRRGNLYQAYCVSTPEGFNFLHETFVVKPASNPTLSKSYRMYKARTYDNPTLPPEYIKSLEENYPPHLIKAYMEGEFVNLATGSVYSNYNRDESRTDKVLDDFPINTPVNIGIDFNYNAMSAVVFVVESKDKVYVVDEIMGSRNTAALIDAIKDRFPNRQINVFPDASGVRAASAAISDRVQLEAAGFRMYALTANPRIRDRVNSVQAMLFSGGKRKLLVNDRRCQVLARCLEEQTYAADGMPKKDGVVDGPLDALGYGIYKLFPLQGRPTIRTA
jgi:hypothetical protein